MRKYCTAFLALFLFTASVAYGQAPDAGIPRGGGNGGVPDGAGDQLGMMSENNSNQLGYLTTFSIGGRTGLVVQVVGAPAGEHVSIQRSTSCDKPGPEVPEAGHFPDLKGGIARAYVNMPQKAFTSGKFIVVVYAVDSKKVVACGEVYS